MTRKESNGKTIYFKIKFKKRLKMLETGWGGVRGGKRLTTHSPQVVYHSFWVGAT